MKQVNQTNPQKKNDSSRIITDIDVEKLMVFVCKDDTFTDFDIQFVATPQEAKILTEDAFSILEEGGVVYIAEVRQIHRKIPEDGNPEHPYDEMHCPSCHGTLYWDDDEESYVCDRCQSYFFEEELELEYAIFID